MMRTERTYRERTKPWYGTAIWKGIRARQLATEPRCALCLQRGKVTQATVADHITPHKGDWDQFIAGPFQSLCQPCHDGDKKRIENGKAPRPAIGPDGWPIG